MRCGYYYPDGARCVYEHYLLGDGEWCAEHNRIERDRLARQQSNAKLAVKRKEQRRRVQARG